MEINELKKKIGLFERNAGFDKTNFSELITMVEEELNILKSNPDDKEIVNHQLTDLLVLLMQIANRYNTNFDVELEKWLKKSEKYL
mgnify:CR=1 FL=1|jgi:hypothetical protein